MWRCDRPICHPELQLTAEQAEKRLAEALALCHKDAQRNKE